MRTILHLLRNDCAALRSWLVGWSLLNVAAFAAQLLPAPDLRRWFDSAQRKLPPGFNVTSPGTVALALLVIMGVLTVWPVIHLHPLGNPGAFWPTRPPGPLRLLAAKIHFVALWLVALPGLLQGLAFACAGFGEWATTAWCDWLFVQSAIVGFACAVGVLTNGVRVAALTSVLSIAAVLCLQSWVAAQQPYQARWTLIDGQAGAVGPARFAVALAVLALGGFAMSIRRYWRRHRRIWHAAALAILCVLVVIADGRMPPRLALLNRPKRVQTMGPKASLAWVQSRTSGRGGPAHHQGSKWLCYGRSLRGSLSEEQGWWVEVRPDWSLTFADGSSQLPHRWVDAFREDLFYVASHRELKTHLGLDAKQYPSTSYYAAYPFVPFFTEPRASVDEMQKRRITLSGILEMGGMANPIIHELPLEAGAGFQHGPFRWRIEKVLRGKGDFGIRVLSEEPMWLALGAGPSWHGPCADAYRYRPYLWNKTSRQLGPLRWRRFADQSDPGRRKRFFADEYSLHGYHTGQESILSEEEKAITETLDVEGTVLIFVEWEIVKWADVPFQTRPFGPLDKEGPTDEPVAMP